MKAPILIGVYLTVTLLPLGLSWLGGRPPRSLWDELASGAGMLAFAIILVEFFLSGRFRAVSGGIGMDVTMRFHQLLARAGLALALAHPFFYRAPSKPPFPWDVSRQLTITDDFGAVSSGVAAWLLLTPLVLLAIGREQLGWRYETWRLLHGLGAALVAGLTLHHALSAGRYSQDEPLVIFWSALFAVALASLLYIYIVKPLMKLASPWSVESIRRLAEGTWEVTIHPARRREFRYRAGQFVWLKLGRHAASLAENPFSISSAPADGARLSFVIKELGDFTRTIGGIPKGTRAYVDGPHGGLLVEGRTEPGIALIAGGVGVAPILSILRQLVHDGDPRPTTVVYGNRIEDQIVCRDELEGLAAAGRIDLTLALYEPPENWPGHRGKCDAALIRHLFCDPEKCDWLYVLCGPPAMLDVVESALLELGVPLRQIISERFVYD